jgi:hypothetical protein
MVKSRENYAAEHEAARRSYVEAIYRNERVPTETAQTLSEEEQNQLRRWTRVMVNDSTDD